MNTTENDDRETQFKITVLPELHFTIAEQRMEHLISCLSYKSCIFVVIFIWHFSKK